MSQPFTRTDLLPEPLDQLRAWFAAAVDAGLPEPEGMALATADPSGRPSLRIVLLKGIDARGVRFFTNYESRKGRELAENPQAALALYWQPLGRQVRLEGAVERLTPEESDAYYASRPRGSRIGAWASPQGRPIPDRADLLERYHAVEARFDDADASDGADDADARGADIPRPDHWGGYRLVPDAVEFWQAGEYRLHNRFTYLREPGGGWRVEQLSP